MITLFKTYREMHDFGDGRVKSFWMALCLLTFGCYPVYREFFLPNKPSLFARIVIWAFFDQRQTQCDCNCCNLRCAKCKINKECSLGIDILESTEVLRFGN